MELKPKDTLDSLKSVHASIIDSLAAVEPEEAEYFEELLEELTAELKGWLNLS